ncbi:MAG: hypothetical protein KDA78_10255, partial [Planctomycetaceae bacterium]|nr:hypothetical protein [Planctomycetaceae bacterium]
MFHPPLVRLLALLLSVLVLTGSPELIKTSQAHPISISDLYVEMQPDHLEIRIEVYLEDLYLFHDLNLEADNTLSLDSIKQGIELHKSFLQERFLILDQDGARIPLKLTSVDAQDVPDFAVPFEQLMFFKVTYHFQAPITEPPTHLTFLHKFEGEKTALPSEVQVKFKPLIGRREQNVILPNQPWTIALQKSGEENPTTSLTPQEQMALETEQTMGIRSYGETYCFLYVEPQQLRVEVLIPLATLAASLEKPIEPDGLIDLEDQQQLKPQLEQLLTSHLELMLGTQPVPLTTDRVEFFGVAVRDFSKNRKAEPVSAANARVGAIFLAKRPEGVSEATLQWSLFNQFLYQLQLILIQNETTTQHILRQVDNQNQFTVSLTPAPTITAECDVVVQPELQALIESSIVYSSRFLLVSIFSSFTCLILIIVRIWDKTNRSRKLRNSVSILFLLSLGVSLLCGGLWISSKNKIHNSLDDRAATEIVQQLLNRVYDAVNQKSEAEIYDQLACACQDELLRSLYLELAESLTMETEQGQIAQAGTVTLQECHLLELLPGRTVQPQLECAWEVPGEVEHWGHIHRRTNQYRAEITLGIEQQPELSRWLIQNLKLKQIGQGTIETSVRK